jgi:hypothetical protein
MIGFSVDVAVDIQASNNSEFSNEHQNGIRRVKPVIGKKTIDVRCRFFAL